MQQEAEKLVKSFLRKKRSKQDLNLALESLVALAEQIFQNLQEETRNNTDNSPELPHWEPCGQTKSAITLVQFRSDLAKLVAQNLGASHSDQELIIFAKGLLSLANHVQNKVLASN